MIGIGVTTYNRPDHLNLCLEQLRQHTPDFKLYIAQDEPRKGIAYRKNECLSNLKDCDYVFLFDDDCFPIKDGWDQFFIQAHLMSKQHHFLYLKETPTIKRMTTVSTDGSDIKILSYDNCGGCMMFMTKEIIKRVGGFGSFPAPYGFEHAAYSRRIAQTGLNHMGPYLCPEGAGEYIYSLDYDDHMDFGINHKSSMTGDYRKINWYIGQNMKTFHENIKTIYHPLEDPI